MNEATKKLLKEEGYKTLINSRCPSCNSGKLTSNKIYVLCVECRRFIRVSKLIEVQ